MKKDAWKNKITNAAELAGTYRPYFEPIIETLASILERRDEAEDLFDKSGGSLLVKHTNKGGATNVEQNPIIRLINTLNQDALSYWRDLGLTPAGLKKIDENKMKAQKRNKLAEVLADLEQ